MRRLSLLFVLLSLGGCSFLQARYRPAPVTPSVMPVLPLALTTVTGVRCNAVRLDQDTVATAAHCVADQAAVMVTELGQGAVARGVVVHPAYELTPSAVSAGVDLARLSIRAVSDETGAIPIRAIQPGAVEIRIPAEGGGYTPIPCSFLGRSGAIVELSCQVSLGWSGAPVVQDGALVGILSARGQGQTAGIAQMADATLLAFF